MTPIDSQQLESYVPVYDAIPDKWEDARAFIVEQFKRVSNAVNIREIGWFLDEELLSGKAFIPGTLTGSRSDIYRTILRKVIPFPGISVGVNAQPHGIFIDDNFSLMQLYAAGTDSVALTGGPIPNGSNTITYTATDIVITSTVAYDRAWAVIEFIQEL